MDYSIDQILDVPLIQALQDKLNAISPFPSALVDLSGNVFTETAWQDVCKKFHRFNPESEKDCLVSDQFILTHMDDANPGVTYICPRGLVDNAIPIVVEGRHIANFFTGQFFLKPPDIEFFRKQAAQFGFNEKAYLEAVTKVPVWTHEKLGDYLVFMKAFTESLAKMGLTRLREIEASAMVRKDSLAFLDEVGATRQSNGNFQGLARDITIKWETEKKLQENLLRFRTIVENTQAGYFFIDRAGIIQDVNDSWVRLYKYSSRDEIVGHHFAEIQRIDNVGEAVAIVNRIMAGDPEYLTGEFTRNCKDGSIGYHTFSAKPVVGDGKVVGIEGFIIDSTNLKIAESERDLSRSRLASVFDQMTEGFALHEIICDEEGNPVDYRFLDVNPAFGRLTGKPTNDIIGKTAKEVFQGLEPVWIERYGKVALSGKPVDFEMFSPSLKRHFRVVAFSNQKGQFATIFDDITDRLAYEEKLVNLALAINCINECVSMTDNENKIIFVNKAFCTTYGYSSEELLGNNISMVRTPDQKTHSSIGSILDETRMGGWNGEVLNRRKDGTDFPVHLSTAIVSDDKNNPIALIGIAKDITERKKNEQELIDAKEKAEESDRLKSAFLANISHEIRTPMNSILGFSGLLEEMVDDPKQMEYLRIISTGGERLLNIINSVIDIAKIEAGQIDLVPTEFDINPLMQELFELNKRRNTRLDFVNDSVSFPPCILITDKGKLFQILNNLLSNALKYTIKGSVHFGYDLGTGDILFYVKDTGIGIPEDFRSKVFERFRKVDLHDRTDFEGTGLGLAITRELVGMLKGTVWFDSEAGRGTTFFVRLPVKQVAGY